MQAGKLDRKIRIERKVPSRDEFGAEIFTWSLLAEVWAQSIPVTGREYFTAAQFVPEASIKFRIRYRSDLEEADTIVYNGTRYDIQYIAEMGRREGLEILAKKP